MISDEMDYESDSGTTNKHRSSCCSEFEAQICCSYVISILSSLLIAGGFYLTILKWDHLWLILPIVGSILIFIGACMYYSGQMDLRRRRRRRNDKIMAAESHGLGRRYRRRNNKDRGPSTGNGIGNGGDNLISSGLNDGRSLSQLSINMIPQYFANSDLPGSLSGPASNLPYSQILRVNGQSFLILPLSGDQASSPPTTNPNDTAISLQNLMVKMPSSKSDQQSKPEASSGIYEKLEELPKRFNKDYTTFTMEDCLPSSSVSHDERNVIGLDNRATKMMNFNRETDPGSQREYHFVSNYFCAPGTSTSHHNNTPIITAQSQPEAQTSRVANGKGSLRMMSQNGSGHAASQSRITNHRGSLIQHPISTTSSIGQASSSSTSSSSRRPLLRRDTFNKDKSSVTVVKSTANQSDSLHAQTTVIADPSISSSPSSSSVVASPRNNTNNKRTENGNNRSVSNSLRLLSSQPGSCNSYSTSEVLVITQSNSSPNPNITSSSSNSTSPNPIQNSIIPGDSLLPDHHHHRRTMDTNNSDETFIVMCGGNASSTGDSDNLNFDDNLIEPGSATPPPSYEEVLSVDTVAGVPNAACNSIAFDTL